MQYCFSLHSQHYISYSRNYCKMKMEKLTNAINKKGDVSSSTVVTTIILIVGFAILVYFLASLFLSGRVDKETCHESVILRGTAPTITGLKGAIPLKCSEEKICITSKVFGGTCTQFENTKGVTTVHVSNADQVARTIAQSVVECWTMMGEGKISIFSNWFADIYGVGSVYPSCVVCAKIAFDADSLSKSKIDPKAIDVSKYMMTHLMPDKEITYYEYLTGQAGKMNIADNLFEAVPKADAPDFSTPEAQAANADYIKIQGEMSSLADATTIETATQRDVDFKADTIGIVFMQISVPSSGEALKNLGYTALGFLGIGASIAPGSFFKNFMPSVSLSKTPTTVPGTATESVWIKGVRYSGPGSAPTTVMKTKIAGKIPKGAKIAAAVGVAVGIFQQVSVLINQGTASGKCEDIAVGEDARTGCSVVRAVKYDPADLETYCSVVESIP